MNSDQKLMAIIVAVGVALGLYLYFDKSPEDVIKARLGELEALLKVEEGETQIQSLSKAKAISKYFTDPMDLNMDLKYRAKTQIRSRKELTQLAAVSRSYVKKLNVSFSNIEVQMGADGNTAKVSTTVKTTFFERDQFDYIELDIQFLDDDGDWNIQSAKTIQPAEL